MVRQKSRWRNDLLQLSTTPTWILTNPEVGACRNTSSVDKPQFSRLLNYVIQEYIGTSGCFTSPLLYGAALNIAEGRQSVSHIQTLNNIGEVNNLRKQRICHRARKLIKSGKAVIHSYDPFTIRLTQRENGSICQKDSYPSLCRWIHKTDDTKKRNGDSSPAYASLRSSGFLAKSQINSKGERNKKRWLLQ